MYALSPRACGPRALGIHIRQIPPAHVTTYTYVYVHMYVWVRFPVFVCVHACVSSSYIRTELGKQHNLT